MRAGARAYVASVLDGKQVIAVLDRKGDRHQIIYAPVASDQSYELTTVSARFPARKNIAVWTSRNRAASARGTERIRAVLSNRQGATSNDKHLSLLPTDQETVDRLSVDLNFSL
jgi:hypothetical protein